MFDLQKTEHEGTCQMPNIEFDRFLRSLTTGSASNKLLDSQTMETVAEAERACHTIIHWTQNSKA